MRKKGIKQKIATKTCGILVNFADYVLYQLVVLGEMMAAPPTHFTMSRTLARLDRAWMRTNPQMLSNALNRLKSHRWLKNDFKITQEGEKRLKKLLPPLLTRKAWDGNWYLVIFDVPENLRRKRDILREKLKDLGFGELQMSVWISPTNYLPVLEKVIEAYGLAPYVIFSQTDKIGRESSRELAEKVWATEKINQEYANLISEWEKTTKETERFFLQFKYFSILKRDPQLPKELLPENWVGEKAHGLVYCLVQRSIEKLTKKK